MAETANGNDDIEFTTVMRPRPRKNRKGKHRAPASNDNQNLVTLLSRQRDALRACGYIEQCKKLLDESWSKSKTESKDFPALVQLRGCICFGLGSLRDSPKSQLQLALLQELLGLLEIAGPVTMIEPAFDAEDESFLVSEGFLVELYKDEFLRIEEPSFFFMPHCPRSLYEKLLEVNQGNLQGLLLLGNPLKQYPERELRAEELDKIPMLRQIGNTLTSIDLPEYEARPDAFNDTAWQWLDTASG